MALDKSFLLRISVLFSGSLALGCRSSSSWTRRCSDQDQVTCLTWLPTALSVWHASRPAQTEERFVTCPRSDLGDSRPRWMSRNLQVREKRLSTGTWPSDSRRQAEGWRTSRLSGHLAALCSSQLLLYIHATKLNLCSSEHPAQPQHLTALNGFQTWNLFQTTTQGTKYRWGQTPTLLVHVEKNV